MVCCLVYQYFQEGTGLLDTLNLSLLGNTQLSEAYTQVSTQYSCNTHMSDACTYKNTAIRVSKVSYYISTASR